MSHRSAVMGNQRTSGMPLIGHENGGGTRQLFAQEMERSECGLQQASNDGESVLPSDDSSHDYTNTFIGSSYNDSKPAIVRDSKGIPLCGASVDKANVESHANSQSAIIHVPCDWTKENVENPAYFKSSTASLPEVTDTNNRGIYPVPESVHYYNRDVQMVDLPSIGVIFLTLLLGYLFSRTISLRMRIRTRFAILTFLEPVYIQAAKFAGYKGNFAHIRHRRLTLQPSEIVSHCVTQRHHNGHYKLRVGDNGEIPRWRPGSTLKYAIRHSSFTTNCEAAWVAQAMFEAVASWNIPGVNFEAVRCNEAASFEIRYKYEPSGQVYAESFFPGNHPGVLFVHELALRGGKDTLVNVLAHEIGHIMGLRHEFALAREWGAVPWGEANPKSVMSYSENLAEQCVTVQDREEATEFYEYKRETHLKHPIRNYEPQLYTGRWKIFASCCR